MKSILKLALLPAAALSLSACGDIGMKGFVANAAPSGPEQTGSTVNSSSSASGLKRVELSVEVGSIKLTAKDGSDLKLTAVRKYDGKPSDEIRRVIEKAKVTAERRGDAFTIKDEVPQELKTKVRNLRLEVELTVPSNIQMAGTIGVGDIIAAGQFAGLNATSGVGSITASGKIGDASIVTGVGDIHVKELSCTGDTFKAHSGTGSVHATLKSIPKQIAEANTGVGDVQLSIPANSRANLHLKTGVGDIQSAFYMPSRERGIGEVGGELTGAINGGGTRIEANTGTGSVRLDRNP